jgi:hypothetical protein
MSIRARVSAFGARAATFPLLLQALVDRANNSFALPDPGPFPDRRAGIHPLGYLCAATTRRGIVLAPKWVETSRHPVRGAIYAGSRKWTSENLPSRNCLINRFGLISALVRWHQRCRNGAFGIVSGFLQGPQRAPSGIIRQFLEGKFSEVRQSGILRSSLPTAPRRRLGERGCCAFNTPAVKCLISLPRRIYYIS